LCLQSLQRHPRVQLDQAFLAQLGQALQGRFHIRVLVALDDLSLRADDVGGEQAGAVQVEPRIEGVLIEGVDSPGEVLRDMRVAHVLAHHAGILAFGQGVVVAMARA
jgi:hypothetical protein